MIPGPHRTKGGATLLGASGPGERGPYGPDSDDIDQEPAQDRHRPGGDAQTR